jgi:DNA-binding Lrp family transcriptional regulator
MDEERVASELLRNPTLDIATIAEKCGFSKQKVWRIVHRMEEEGAILSHPTSLDLKKVGKRSFLILFERSFRVVDSKLITRLTMPEMLAEMDAEGIAAVVEDSYYLNGAYDWAIVITVAEHKDLIRFMELWRKYYGEYFSKVIQSEVMFTATRNSVLNPKLNELKDILR